MNNPGKTKKTKKNFTSKDKVGALFMRELRAACRPLTFISETDAEVIPFAAEKPTTLSLDAYVAALGVTSTEIEERDFNNFFDRLTSEKDWHGPIEKARSKRWSNLRDVLEKNLDHLRVIRVGRIRLDIYIAGLDASGRLAGVKTKAIET